MKTNISSTVRTRSLRALCLALSLVTLASCVCNYPQPPPGPHPHQGPVKTPGSVGLPPIKVNPPKAI